MAILGALGEFRGMFRAKLGTQKMTLRMQKTILGWHLTSREVNNTILGTTPGTTPGINGNSQSGLSYAPSFSERSF